MANPVTRKEQFLNAIALGDPSLLPTPVTREERFLRALSTGEEITPTTFEERFLQAALAFKGSDGGGGAVVGGELFDGVYHLGTLITTSNVRSGFGDGHFTALIPCSGGDVFDISHIKSATEVSRYAFTNAYPIFSGDERIIIPDSYVTLSTNTAQATAPPGALYLAFNIIPVSTPEAAELSVILV